MQKNKKLISIYPKWLVLALTAAIGCFWNVQGNRESHQSGFLWPATE